MPKIPIPKEVYSKIYLPHTLYSKINSKRGRKRRNQTAPDGGEKALFYGKNRSVEKKFSSVFAGQKSLL